MDPLSIAASVSGFISLVGGAIDYLSDFRGAKSDRDDLIERLRRLKDALKSLESRVTRINNAKDEARVGAFGRKKLDDKLFRRYEGARRPGGRFEMLRTKFSDLFDTHFQKDPSKWAEFKLRASWRWKKDGKKALVDDIVETVRSLRDFLSDDDAEMQHEMFLGVRRLERTNEEKEIVDILNWISPAGLQPTDFLASKHSPIRYIPDPFIKTKVYEQWTTDAGARNWHLSCYGGPGTGKSHRSRTVIWDLSQRFLPQGIPVVFVLFNHQNRSNQSLKSVYCMLLRQILSQSATNEIPPSIRDAWNRARLDNSTSPTETEAKNFLLQELKKYPKKFIIADALDEAGDSISSIHAVLSALRKEAKACIFSTSRQNPRKVFNIDRKCDGCNARIEGLSWQCDECTGSMYDEVDFCAECYLDKNARCKFPWHKMSIPEHVYVEVSPSSDDIEFFVEKSLQKELDEDDTGDEDQLIYSSYAPMLLQIKSQFGARWTTVPGEIAKAAGDSYLVADLVVRRLIAQVTFADAEAIMDGLQEHSGNSWDSQYTEMLNMCLDEDDPEGRKVAYTHFSLLYCAQDVLSFEQISHAIAVRENDKTAKDFGKRCYNIHTVRKKTHGLLSVGDFGNPDNLNVSFFHRTLSSYLEQHGRTWFPDANETMFNSCLAYLHLEIFQHPFGNLKDLDEALKKYPFASYAACNWGEHLREKPANISDLIAVLEIFNDQLRMATILQIALHTFSRANHAWDVSGGVSPLHIGAFYGLKELCQILLVDGEDVNIQEPDYGQTPLHYAARWGHLDTIRCLLNAGADINITSNRGSTPLMEAVESSRLEAVDLILTYKAVDVNRSSGSTEKSTALVLAAKSGKRELLENLLRHDAIEVNKPDGSNVSALARAVRFPSLECVDLLLSHPKIDLDVRDKMGTPLENIANPDRGGQEAILEDIVKSFLKHPQCSPISGKCLAMLIEQRRDTLVNLFLSQYSYETWKDDNGRNLMHVAAGVSQAAAQLVYGHLSQATSFDISAADNHGNTPLHATCLRFTGYKWAIAEFLLSKGAKPLPVNFAGHTPLDLACQSSPAAETQQVLSIFGPYLPSGCAPSADRMKPTLQRIIDRGNVADLKLFLEQAPQDLTMNKDPYTGWTSLHVTAQRRRDDLLGLLLPRAQQYIDTTSDAGRTSLHSAVLAGSVPSVQLLLSAGANPNLKDKWDETPFDLAQKRNDAGASALLLINFGASLPAKDEIKQELIHEAVAASNVDAVEKLIAAEVDIIYRKNVTGPTPLALAQDIHSLAVGKAMNDINDDLAKRSGLDETGFRKMVNETPEVKASKEIVDLLQDAITKMKGRGVDGGSSSKDPSHNVPPRGIKSQTKHRDLSPLIKRLKHQKSAGHDLKSIMRNLHVLLEPHDHSKSTNPPENGITQPQPPPPYDKAISSSSSSHRRSVSESNIHTRDNKTSATAVVPPSTTQSSTFSKEEKIAIIVMVGIVIIAYMWLNIHYQTRYSKDE